MLFLSDRMTSASGSIGGTTFSHNRSGLYTRARRVPVNPRTPAQLAVRSGLSALQGLYPTLSGADQAGWQTLADTMTFRNRLGQTFNMTAQQIFVGANLNVAAATALIGVSPTTFRPDSATRCPLNAPALIPGVTAGSSTASLAFDNTEAWANDNAGLLFVYASRGQNSTKNFFVGPYRLAAVINGANPVPPTSPKSITLPFTAGVAGTKIFFKVVAVLASTYYPSSPARFAGVAG